MTVSVGRAMPRYLDRPSVPVERADRALYRANRRGRNRPVVADGQDLALTA